MLEKEPFEEKILETGEYMPKTSLLIIQPSLFNMTLILNCFIVQVKSPRHICGAVSKV